MSNPSKTRILVVDNDPSTRELLQVLLKSAGYDVATADDGVTAVMQLSPTLPDVLVTDLNMPQMSGMELISHVRSLHPWVPIVAMSGNYHGEAVAAGIIADRFYLKGQPFQNLLATIAALVAASPSSETAQENLTQQVLNS